MTEPPRPPGDSTGGAPPPDPTTPQPPPSGGYAPPPPPPPGGYAPPPPSGAYPPGPGFAPPGYASSDDKTWALIAHFGGALGMFISGGVLGFVAPLIAYLVKGQQSPTARSHPVAALNFQLTWSIISVVGYVLGACGSLVIVGAVFFLVPLAATVLGVVFGIIAGVKANDGQPYRYPMSINMIK
ncbi:DUF4870 domain-containing protein [Planosporangium flavigriseum]|nr:DUF4870 domain-containing protein [Planosporangium flavigriseum]NJC67178.1 DUF4870 domain-containing protein [Planosporangium flavigriseum]